MFLIDDILFAPVKGLLWIFDEMSKRVDEEMKDTPEKLKKELLDIQEMLRLERISEKTYASREKNILERINALRK